MEQLELWSKCSKNLESSLSQDEYNTWIRPLKASKKKNTLELVAPNDFILDYIEKNFANSIQDLVKKYFKLAVDRNKIKRRVKEIIRKNGYGDFLSNGFVFSVFRPFAGLSYENANKEIQEAIKKIKKIS